MPNTPFHQLSKMFIVNKFFKSMSFKQIEGKRLWIAIAILVFGFLLSLVACLSIKSDIENVAKKEFEFVCNELKSKISTRLHSHAQLLRSGAAFFQGSKKITREEWRSAYKSQMIEKNLPGIQGVGYAVIIAPGDLNQHEKNIRKEGFPKYSVKPKGNRKIYTSIIYLEPFTGRNIRAFGYDMFSEPIRREAMEKARDYNIASISGKIILVQETNEDIQAGTLMYVPVYQKNMPSNTIDERRSAIKGWVYSPYRMNDLMKGILGGYDAINNKRIRLEIFDQPSFSNSAKLFDSKNSITQHPSAQSSFNLKTEISFNGHKWYLLLSQFDPLNASFDYSKVWLVGISGITISILLFIIYLSLITTSLRAKKLAEELTKELGESEAKYRTIFNNEIYAICIFDLKTLKLLDVNDAYCSIYGYTKEELLSGMTIHEITAEHQASDSATNQAIDKGTVFIPLRYHKKKDGTEFPVEIVGGPYTWKGEKVMFALAHDISERKNADDLLIKWTNIFKSAQWGIVIGSADGKSIELMNPAFAAMHGFTEEELRGKPIADLFPLESRAEVIPNINLAHQLGHHLWESKHIRKDGTVFPVLIDVTVVKKIDGDVLYRIVNVQDITERKKAEEEIAVSHKQLQEAQHIAHLGNWELDILSERIYWSSEIYNILDVDSSSCNLSLEIFYSFVHPEDRDFVRESYGSSIKNKTSYDIIYRLLLSDNRIKYVHEKCKTEYNSDGVAVNSIGTIQDITQFKILEEATIKSEKEYQRLIESMQEGVLVVDNDDVIQFVNHAFTELIGYTKEELLGKTGYKLLLDPKHGELILKKNRDRANGIREEYEIEMIKKNGDKIIFNMNASPIMDQEGLVVGSMATCLNITKRKETEEIITRTKSNYESFFNTIDDFLFVLDLQGQIIYTNSTVKERLGYTEEELIGESVLMVHPLERRDEAGRIVGEMLQGKAEFCPVPLITKNGEQIKVETRVTLGNWDGNQVIFGVTKDISDITLSEEKFSKAFHLNPSACGLSDLQTGKYLEVNESFSTLLGYDKSEVIGSSALELDIMTNEVRRKVLNLADENGRVINTEITLKAKNGELKQVLLSAENISVQDKKMRYTVVYDISDLKRAQSKIEEIYDRLQKIASRVPGVVFQFRLHPDGSYSFPYASAGLKDLYDIDPEELMKDPSKVLAFHHPDDLSGILSSIQKSAKDIKPWNHEFRLKFDNGNERWVVSNSTPQREEDGSILWNGVLIDITTRKYLEKALEEYKVRLELTLASTNIAWWEMDIKTGNISFSDRKAEMLGYSPSQFHHYKDFMALVHPDDFEPTMQAMRDHFTGEKEIYEVNYRILTSSGGYKWFADKGSIIARDEYGLPDRISGIVIDITERKLEEAELSEYRNQLEELVKARTEELEKTNISLKKEIDKQKEYELILKESLNKEKELNEMKSRFISTTSHEFRTPLTSIITSAGLLYRYGNKWNDEKKAEHYERIEKAVSYQTKLLDDILIISRTQAGEIGFHPEQVDLYTLIEEIVQDTRSVLTEKYKLTMEYKSDRRMFKLDSKLMRFILNNLISNGIKYSPDGGTVEIVISTDMNQMVIDIRDEGIGIPEQEKGKIFDSFYRTKNAENIPGNGLGLAIVKSSVDLHGGEITVKSELNMGTTFTVKIPVHNLPPQNDLL